MGNCSSDEARGRRKFDQMPVVPGEPVKPDDMKTAVQEPVETEIEKTIRVFSTESEYGDCKKYFPDGGFEIDFLERLPEDIIETIFMACGACNAKITMHRMLEKWPKLVNHRDANGCTPLMVAAEYFWPDCVEILLKAGADVNAITCFDCGQKFDALAFAIHPAPGVATDGKGAERLQIVKMLIEAGTNTKRLLHFSENGRSTHLIEAVYHTRRFGSTAEVELLIPVSDINTRVACERTALMVAVRNIFTLSTAGTIELLLDNGAVVAIYDEDGVYPYQYAEEIEGFPPQLLDRLRLPPPSYVHGNDS